MGATQGDIDALREDAMHDTQLQQQFNRVAQHYRGTDDMVFDATVGIYKYVTNKINRILGHQNSAE